MTMGVEKPPPTSLFFQSIFGPSLGHSLSSPFSFEMPVRSGPCHCGQSSARAATVSRHAATKPRDVQPFFIVYLLKWMGATDTNLYELVSVPTLARC